MAVLIVGTEKNFAALRPRLFEGRISSKAAGEVADAIRAANPHADLDKLAPGTVLRIPDTPRVSMRGELSLDETTDERDRRARRGRPGGARGAGGDGGGPRTRNRGRAQGPRQGARGEGARRRDAGRAALKPDVEAARAAVEEEGERAKQRTAALKRAQAEWTAELDALKTQFD